MGRNTGNIGLDKSDFIQQYSELMLLHADPLVVMFKLLGSRKQAIRFQASRELLSYRFPKQATAKVEIELPSQLSLQWELSNDEPQASLIEINPVDLMDEI